MNKKQDDLRQTLVEWRLEPPRDPAFRARVRERLEARTSRAAWPSFARRHVAGLAVALSMALLAGGWLGQSQAHRQADRDRETLARAYLASIDARYQADLDSSR